MVPADPSGPSSQRSTASLASGARSKATPTEKPGDQIGAYTLVRLIGHGGFGAVWEAERRHPMVQRVALKIVRPGMDSVAIIARFDQERQTLALMDHPNIAKIFDGGVTQAGRPFFVMEYIDGEPLTDFCDRHRLTVRQRLGLFIPVCKAIQHAHTKGIIHRDLKPANILVTVRDNKPMPKVIDFGIAKAISGALADGPAQTIEGMIIGTPEYMSPEQAEVGAVDIDTRTDVYSLGVVLYELLTGCPPYDIERLRAHGYAAILKLIREAEPPRPSDRVSGIAAESSTAKGTRSLSDRIAGSRRTQIRDLASDLRRELEWVPLMAMRKDRRHRYQSPQDLANDLQRYLKNEALLAGPESMSYRVKKFARRHRALAGSIAAVSTALVFGLIGTMYQAHRVRHQATLVAKEAALARAAEAEQRRLAAAEAQARIAADAAKATAQHAEQLQRVAAEEARYHSYRSCVSAAAAMLSTTTPTGAMQSLESAPAEYRGWEWRYLRGEADTSAYRIDVDDAKATHSYFESIESLAISPDSSQFAIGLYDGRVELRTVPEGTLVTTLRGHSAGVLGIVFVGNSSLVTSSLDGHVLLWDTHSGTQSREIAMLDKGAGRVDVTGDGETLALAGNDGLVRLYATKDFSLQRSIAAHDGAVTALRFSQDGKRIGTGGRDGHARILDSETGARLAEIFDSAVYTRPLPVWVCQPLPGSDICASGGSGQPLFLFSPPPTSVRKRVPSFGDFQHPWDADLLRDGKSMLTGSRRVFVVSTDDWRVRAELRGNTKRIHAARASPDGRWLITAGEDFKVRLWPTSVLTIRPRVAGFPGGYASAVVCDPAGHWIAVLYSNGSLRVHTPTGKELAQVQQPKGTRGRLAISPDGQLLATLMREDEICLWRAPGLEPVATLSLGRVSGESLAFVGPDNRLVVGLGDGTLVALEPLSGKELARSALHSKAVSCIAVCNATGMVATGGPDKHVRLWTSSLLPLGDIGEHSGAISTLLFDPAGERLFSGETDATLGCWSIATRQKLSQISSGGDSFVTLGYLPDGPRVLSGLYSGELVVWDFVRGAELTRLHDGSSMTSQTALAVSPDGLSAFVGDGGGWVRRLDARPWGAWAQDDALPR